MGQNGQEFILLRPSGLAHGRWVILGEAAEAIPEGTDSDRMCAEGTPLPCRGLGVQKSSQTIPQT